ncbi:uncharacterized protein zgc:194930 isoform X2 [Betta splendens]|uniref:Uncharacterized protein zgc:194930 isoform X2 n=1 Tax=Betta splendens TaxID=158456 RepID=A0A6P7LW51_BETSP|nr:uncharacterized protein zgc:194930 isoform X2 [Betta splendens]
MGCQCCRMIKSYIYDPSVAVDVRKPDGAGSSLYQPRLHAAGPPGCDPLAGHAKHKHGFHNLGYSKSNESTLKLEADNNHVNQRLHAALTPVKDSAPAPEGPYIIRPEPREVQQRTPSQVPVYPNIQEYQESPRSPDGGWDRSLAECRSGSESPSADEGVGGTPEYPCDTGDEGSVLSVDVHTSTTSLSSAETRDGAGLPGAESGVSVATSEDAAAGRDAEEARSVTDSMVAEALAALEAATAGEDDE